MEDSRPEKAPGVFRIREPSDFARIPFHDDMAAVEVPFKLLRHVKFKSDHREQSERLDYVLRSIRQRGYIPRDPIIARIGQKGRWIIVDGGHRLTAARQVAGEFWSNIFSRKVNSIYFLLYTDARSWRKVKNRAARVSTGQRPPPSRLPEAPPPDVSDAEAEPADA